MSKQARLPVHVRGIYKGEEMASKKGKEPGRGKGTAYRTARDSTGINAKHHDPIVPGMPYIPPA